MNQTFCYDCEQELTLANTEHHQGVDSFQYQMAIKLSPSIAETFIKCDDCFEADIDAYLDSQEY